MPSTLCSGCPPLLSNNPSPPAQHPASVSWQGRLDQAADRQEVVDVARDFLASITPEETAQLPLDCRPGKLVDGDDVAEYALTLVRRSCEGDALGDHNLQRLAAFFGEALVRLSQLATSAARASPDLLPQ